LKYLGWILFFVIAALGIVLYNTKYRSLQSRYDQQARENDMWINQTEQLKQKASMDQTRQNLAPEASLLLADVFTSPDSFDLSKFGRDTLGALATEIRSSSGQVTVSIFTDDSTINLYTKQKYPDVFAYSAARGAAVIRYLMSQGVPAERLLLVAHGTASTQEGGLPDLRPLAGRRLEIRVEAAR
jgi:outer membrane protein OmpA-like peptidoglycan-associated protein